MRVYAVHSATGTNYAVQKSPVKKFENQKTDSFEKSTPAIPQINFGSYRIHIIDGGAHGEVMEHFARAIVRSVDDVVDVIMHKAETNPRYSGMKQMKSIKEKLTFLNEGGGAKAGDYVAVPCSAQVQLNLLSDLMELKPQSITPISVKHKKQQILEFLKNLSGWKMTSMDPNGQGMEHVYGVIQQINELIKKGVNVYLPAGHPIEGALKAVAASHNGKDALYEHIYTGGKKNGFRISLFKDELLKDNIYKFNLLALSDAHVVNVKDLSGRNNHVFAAYDACVNDGARGVFNFYPVRNKEGEILGYSFTDKKTVQYPVEEYLANDEFANIAKFVGKPLGECTADGSITHMMKNMIKWDEPHPSFPDVLYPVQLIYSAPRLKAEKLLEKGRYVDKSEQLFFDVNDCSEVIFRKCDCEGSGRPSVIPMWGSCFATINAIKRDIAAHFKQNKVQKFDHEILSQIGEVINKGYDAFYDKQYKAAEFFFNKTIKLARDYDERKEPLDLSLNAHRYLLDVLLKQNKTREAEGVANGYINTQCKSLLYEFRQAKNIKQLNDMHFAHYWEFPEHEVKFFKDKIDTLASTFKTVAALCRKKGNERASEVSEWAAGVISKYYAWQADPVISRRASGSISMGDIFDAYNGN